MESSKFVKCYPVICHSAIRRLGIQRVKGTGISTKITTCLPVCTQQKISNVYKFPVVCVTRDVILGRDQNVKVKATTPHKAYIGNTKLMNG